MGNLQRITTDYIALEDRIRLTGALSSGDTVVLWLTQRLLTCLVPHLSAWLDRQIDPLLSSFSFVQAAHQDFMQGFAQQAAQAQLVQEPPVHAITSQVGRLVDVVDIAQRKDAVMLTFKSKGQSITTLTLTSQPLRQWLGIVYKQYLRGEWRMSAWPEWMVLAQAKSASINSSELLH